MNELTHHIFELLLYKIGIVKSIFKTVKFSYYIKKNNASHLVQPAFYLLVRLWREKKWRQTPWTSYQRS